MALVNPTTGFYRFATVISRATAGLAAQIVPLAQILVTVQSSGAVAVIYQDPALSIPISGGLVTADIYGNYGFYLPLNYLVTETISSPNGALVTINNVGVNGPIVGSLTTSSGSSDVFSATGILSTSHVSLTPTNSSAATMIASVYVSAKAAGSITVSHSGTAGATFDVLVTPY